MARARIPDDAGQASVRSALAGEAPATAQAVRYLLQRLAERSPGNSVEVRVPPYGAVQCIAGPRHTRGTPPNVVEMTADVWLPLAAGRVPWSEVSASGEVHASGVRADLAGVVPVWTA